MARESELAVRAIAAADRLFKEDEPDETGGLFEPSDEHTAKAAIKRFGELFAELRGVPKSVIERARNTGDLVSSDPLQGLAEIVQNADDAEATEIVLQLSRGELLVSHNGNPVRLPHVLALATPWLTTKGGQAALMGRFGIGLTTLRSLSETFEVHCDPYHVRFGDPFVSPIRAAAPASRTRSGRMDYVSGSLVEGHGWCRRAFGLVGPLGRLRDFVPSYCVEDCPAVSAWRECHGTGDLAKEAGGRCRRSVI